MIYISYFSRDNCKNKYEFKLIKEVVSFTNTCDSKGELPPFNSVIKLYELSAYKTSETQLYESELQQIVVVHFLSLLLKMLHLPSFLLEVPRLRSAG